MADLPENWAVLVTASLSTVVPEAKPWKGGEMAAGRAGGRAEMENVLTGEKEA